MGRPTLNGRKMIAVVSLKQKRNELAKGLITDDAGSIIEAPSRMAMESSAKGGVL